MKHVISQVREAPFVHAVAGAMMFSAANVLVQQGASPNGKWAILAFSIAAFISGLAILSGLQWRGSKIWSNGIERAGHYGAMAVWLIDAYLLWEAGSWLNLAIPALLCFASAVRATNLRKHNRVIVETVHQLRGGVDA